MNLLADLNLLGAAYVNWHTFTFLFFALLACGFGAAVLATSNVVRMAFYLTLSLGATAGLFFLAGAEFVGAMQLMIYVGGTLVLLIFGVMLTAQERFISMKTGAGEWVTGLIVGGTLLVLLIRTAFSVPGWNPNLAGATDEQPVAGRTLTLDDSHNSTEIGVGLSGVRVDKLDEKNALRRQGMSGYLLPFVIISMHLLTVLIGAGYMARTKRKGGGRLAPVAPRAAVPVNRKFPASVWGGLIAGWITNLWLIGSCVALMNRRMWLPAGGRVGEWSQSFLNAAYGLPGWIWPMLILTFVINILLLFVVYNWQKWGLVALIAVPLVQYLLLVNAGVVPWLAGALAASMLIPAVLLALLCVFGTRPSVWSQME
jgi:NADH-quinone oxidoreductase subunit J